MLYSFFNGLSWCVQNSEGVSIHPTASGQYPPKTGYPAINGAAVSLDFGCHKIDDDGELIARDYANYLATDNLTLDELQQWEDLNGVKLLKKLLQYNQGSLDPVDGDLTASEYARWLRYIGDTDAGGDLLGGMVPATCTAGTGIGPDLDWLDVGDGMIVFVDG